jgi:hypothetical protein
MEINMNKSKFFEFFKTKRLKLSLVIFFGTIGVVSNYSALKYFLGQTRMDFIGSEFSLTVYAIGITLALDVSIIVFHLARIYGLMFGSALLAFMISLGANTTTYFACAGSCKNALDDFGTIVMFSQSLVMSVLPIIIIVYLTELAVKQYDSEIEEVYKNSWQEIKLD